MAQVQVQILLKEFLTRFDTTRFNKLSWLQMASTDQLKYFLEFTDNEYQ